MTIRKLSLENFAHLAGKFQEGRRLFIKTSAFVFLAGLLLSAGSCGAANWVPTWFAAPQSTGGSASDVFHDQTVRQIMHVSAGGSSIRIHVSNLFGTTPIHIQSMHVAKSTGGSTIDANSDKAVTLLGKKAMVIEPGHEIVSDMIPMSVKPLSDLAISIYVSDKSPVETLHGLGLQSNYIAPGNVVSSATITATESKNYYAWITRIDVQNISTHRVIDTFGDSITDGTRSTPYANMRYPDQLANFLLSGSSSYSVINAGIDGNSWRWGGDQKGDRRFARDVLGIRGVTDAVILLGINDICLAGLLNRPELRLSANQIIRSITDAATSAKAAHIRVFVGTLTPFAGTRFPGYYSVENEGKRQAVNAFIRSTKLIDGVIDFDVALNDPANPGHMLYQYDSGDGLHPSDAGYQRMAIIAGAALKQSASTLHQ
jgi:lysophospholipase L1-like esterase